MEEKRFISTNPVTIEHHSCGKCKELILNAFTCEFMCSKYCSDHLPSSNLCDVCSHKLSSNEKFSKILNEKYIVKCSKCKKEIKLKDYEIHECILKKCIQGCEMELKQEEMEEHVREECLNTILYCLGNEYRCIHKAARGLMNLHRLECKDFLEWDLERNRNAELEEEIKKSKKREKELEFELKDREEQITKLKKKIEKLENPQKGETEIEGKKDKEVVIEEKKG